MRPALTALTRHRLREHFRVSRWLPVFAVLAGLTVGSVGRLGSFATPANTWDLLVRWLAEARPIAVDWSLAFLVATLAVTFSPASAVERVRSRAATWWLATVAATGVAAAVFTMVGAGVLLSEGLFGLRWSWAWSPLSRTDGLAHQLRALQPPLLTAPAVLMSHALLLLFLYFWLLGLIQRTFVVLGLPNVLALAATLAVLWGGWAWYSSGVSRTVALWLPAAEVSLRFHLLNHVPWLVGVGYEGLWIAVWAAVGWLVLPGRDWPA